MSSRARSRPLAFGTVAASVATLGYMYYASTQMKQDEGQQSIYKKPQASGELRSASGGSDARMGSADVRAAVQGDNLKK
ncbi:hypothetical protein B0H21DRAFT_821850 [Amylocystis lapponica]|nr:hypothetical protein B0H21DRAFT_821850 [Amylocystis lapponica]